MLRPATLTVLMVALVSTLAHAEPSPMDGMVAGAVRRARRSIAIGPVVGGAVAYLPSPAKAEYPISFGLELELFKIPVVPDLALVREVVIARIKARVTDRVKEIVMAGGSIPPRDELEQMGRAMAQEVAGEVMGEMSARPKVVEKPRLAVALEGAYLPVAKAWQFRATVGVGLTKVTIGPTLAIDLTSPRGLFLGGELALHLMPRPTPRSPVIDLFLRGDFGVTSATKHGNQGALGLRVLVDIL